MISKTGRGWLAKNKSQSSLPYQDSEIGPMNGFDSRPFSFLPFVKALTSQLFMGQTCPRGYDALACLLKQSKTYTHQDYIGLLKGYKINLAVGLIPSVTKCFGQIKKMLLCEMVLPLLSECKPSNNVINLM